MIEALTDPKTWLFALFSALDNVPNSITNQIQIIVLSFGFNPFQTTLLGCVRGVIQMISILSGVTIVSRIPNSRAWVAIAYFVPNIIGVFLVNFLPWHDKVGLLFSVWMAGTDDSFIYDAANVILVNQASVISLALSYPLHGYHKRLLDIQRRLRQTPLCYLRTA